MTSLNLWMHSPQRNLGAANRKTVYLGERLPPFPLPGIARELKGSISNGVYTFLFHASISDFLILLCPTSNKLNGTDFTISSINLIFFLLPIKDSFTSLISTGTRLKKRREGRVNREKVKT